MNLLDSGQPWIPTGERSGLLTRIVTESVSLTAFLELESIHLTTRHGQKARTVTRRIGEPIPFAYQIRLAVFPFA